jgi:uncharacterized protein YcbK (DUF882 family)
MRQRILENQSGDDENVVLSRRRFLKNVAYGSLLTLGTPMVAQAARHVIYPHKASLDAHPHPKKPDAHSQKHKGADLHAHAPKADTHRHPHKGTDSHLHAHKADGHHRYTHRNIDTPTYAQQNIEVPTPRSLMSSPSHRTIALQNLHGDRVKLTYFENGRYIRPAMREIDHVLRDYRTGDIHSIDPSLLDLLHDLKLTLETERPFQIICGYRSPETNAMRHRESAGVASHSLHMEGKAIDIRIEGVSTHHIRNAAISLAQGGVGYYSDFVHVDTGNFRTWG